MFLMQISRNASDMAPRRHEVKLGMILAYDSCMLLVRPLSTLEGPLKASPFVLFPIRYWYSFLLTTISVGCMDDGDSARSHLKQADNHVVSVLSLRYPKINEGIPLLHLYHPEVNIEGTTSSGCGESYEPVDPPPISPVSVGVSHACVIDTNSKALCWNWHTDASLQYDLNLPYHGQIGDKPSTWPVFQDGTFVQISAYGNTTCGITKSGTVDCWGRYYSSEHNQKTVSIVDIAQVSVENDYTCALSKSGEVFCWANLFGPGMTSWGRLWGHGSWERPERVDTKLRFVQIATSGQHNCALTKEGRAYCWGYNHDGQLGTGDTENRRVPTPVETTTRFKAIVTAYTFSCGLDPWV